LAKHHGDFKKLNVIFLLDFPEIMLIGHIVSYPFHQYWNRAVLCPELDYEIRCVGCWNSRGGGKVEADSGRRRNQSLLIEYRGEVRGLFRYSESEKYIRNRYRHHLYTRK